MHLTASEHERLLLFLAAELARRRRDAGVRLNCPEAIALISDELIEAARRGRSYDDVCALGYELLSRDDVLDGVAEMVDRLQVEPLFESGTHLVTLHYPIAGADAPAEGDLVPGEIRPADGPEPLPDTDGTVELAVANELDRAVQVTSHYHFFEVNRGLRFDRAAAVGMRLDVPAGLSVRFEPGETHVVRLRPFGGARHVHGFHRLVDGDAGDPAVRANAVRLARARGFADTSEEHGDVE